MTPILVGILRHRKERDGLEILTQFVVFRVRLPPHFIDRIGFPRRTLRAKGTPDRVFAFKDMLGEHFIDDRDFGRIERIAFVKIAGLRRTASPSP